MNPVIQKLKQSTAAKVAIVLILLYAIVHHCSKSTTPTVAPPAVMVKKPVLAEVVDYVTQTGTLVAFNSVDLVARVEGYLDAIEFTDGSYIKKGKELFVIQPQPYMEQLKSAQAQVAIAKSDFAYSKSEYARQQRMYKQNATSLNSVESWLAKMQEAQGQVEKAIADQALAQITYGYTHVNAPFDGRIGRHLVSVGSLVGNGTATNLATLEQVDPLYVYFNINELDFLKLREAAHAAGIKSRDLNQVPVYIALQSEHVFKYKATLNFVNTGLNASTGTMEFRAILENKKHVFVPGLFVQVRIAISKPKPELTVPDTAILYDQIGPYLLTVDTKNIVVLKRITIGSVNNGMRAIVQGLTKDDAVIVNGLQFATPGNPVQPTEETGASNA